MVLGYSFFGDGQSNGVIQFYPGPSLVAMETNFETKWAITRLCKRHQRDFCIYRGVFGDVSLNAAYCIFPRPTPVCHGNEIWDKIGYNSPCVRDICKIFVVYMRVFGDGSANAAN